MFPSPLSKSTKDYQEFQEGDTYTALYRKVIITDY